VIVHVVQFVHSVTVEDPTGTKTPAQIKTAACDIWNNTGDDGDMEFTEDAVLSYTTENHDFNDG